MTEAIANNLLRTFSITDKNTISALAQSGNATAAYLLEQAMKDQANTSGVPNNGR